MKQSTNYGFNIPEPNDALDIEVIGQTIEQIDKTLKEGEAADYIVKEERRVWENHVYYYTIWNSGKFEIRCIYDINDGADYGDTTAEEYDEEWEVYTYTLDPDHIFQENSDNNRNIIDALNVSIVQGNEFLYAISQQTHLKVDINEDKTDFSWEFFTHKGGWYPTKYSVHVIGHKEWFATGDIPVYG